MKKIKKVKRGVKPEIKYKRCRMEEFLKGFHQYMTMRRYLLDEKTYSSLKGYCYNKWVAEYTDKEVHPDVYAFLERRVPQFFERYKEVRST